VKINRPKKILVIRNDKIGDFMLSWPAFSLLKKQYPDAEITALVPGYTADLAEQCAWIDKILIDKKQSQPLNDIYQLASTIKSSRFDLSISLFSETRTSAALWLARVKTRIGPATKIAQVFLNKRLKQKRSRSTKPEYEYNLDLVRYFIKLCGDTPVEAQQPPLLAFDHSELQQLKHNFYQQHAIEQNSKLMLIHPGTGGSAINLSIEQYAGLARSISAVSDVHIVITAGPGELSIANKLSGLMKDSRHHVHSSDSGIIEFCKFIGIADVFISGSTGPLHIAGALNINTAAFYPARRSATALRWQTINSPQRRLCFSPEKFTGENDMMQIDIKKSANAIVDSFLSRAGD